MTQTNHNIDAEKPKRILKCHSCGTTGGSASFECAHCGSLVTEIVSSELGRTAQATAESLERARRMETEGITEEDVWETRQNSAGLGVSMSNETTNEPHTCQRGVDGSPGCGHDESQVKDGICQGYLAYVMDNCGHRCEFSPPLEDETHEFVPSFNKINCYVRIGRGFCGQPADAPVHKVSAHFDDRNVDPRAIPEKWLSDVKFFDHIQGTSTVCTWQCAVCFQKWDSNAKLPCPRCRPNWKDELAALTPAEPQRPISAESEPPARVYVPLPYAGICSTVDRPDLPQATYAHLEPIRAALEACEATSAILGGCVRISDSRWEALVKSVKGESE